MAIDSEEVRTPANAATRRLSARAAKAAARAKQAKEQVRAAKAQLKKARKLAKAAKKAAKQARKNVEAAADRAAAATNAEAAAAAKPAGTKAAGTLRRPKSTKSAKPAVRPKTGADRPRPAAPKRAPKPRQSAAQAARSVIDRLSSERVDSDAAAGGEASNEANKQRSRRPGVARRGQLASARRCRTYEQRMSRSARGRPRGLADAAQPVITFGNRLAINTIRNTSAKKPTTWPNTQSPKALRVVRPRISLNPMTWMTTLHTVSTT